MHMSGLLLYTLSDFGQPAKLFIAILSQSGAFLQVVWLLGGTLELITNTKLSKQKIALITCLTLLVAIVTASLFHNDPSAFQLRYLLRYGLRELLATISYLAVSIIVWRNPTFTKGLGQKMLAINFFLFSAQQFFYLSIVLTNVFGGRAEMPSFFGLFDVLLVALIAMSMVMWLLEDEREKLRSTNHELDSFLYSTSHDLRAPLASILGLTNIARHDIADETAKSMFGMIEERAKKLDLVIEDILNLARSKKKELVFERIDFGKFLQEVVNDVKFTKGATDIRLIYQEHKANWLVSDRSQLKIILGNLLSNAVKYHNTQQADPFIEVTFQTEEKRVVISVIDNGQGIPGESQSRIFEMFYRASANTEGTGLGLYITKEAVSKLQGEIRFTSKEGTGTTFTVSLPSGRGK